VAQYFRVHPVDPQRRLLLRAAEIVRAGGIVVYPTDSSYAFGWHIGDKQALEKIRWLRQTERDHDFTLVCRDLSDIAAYARVDNWAYRLLKSLTPGPYTFILRATHEVPKRLQDPKRRSIGIRVPDNRIAQCLLEALGEPLMSSTLLLPGDPVPLTDPEDIRDRLAQNVDAIIDGGACGLEPTSIIDFSNDDVRVLRKGKGDVTSLEQ
jgi:tRNA threonylcarbamoyl adenosine modification protein (Sua5/YciO/YrdC/YwlC family)